jgi:ankyrin repeat protein
MSELEDSGRLARLQSERSEGRQTGSGDDERCAEAARFARVDSAIRSGDLSALRAALDDPPGFPNVPALKGIGNLLAYAIYHGPFGIIRQLLDAGADVNYDEHDGFPALITALSARPCPGYPGRSDRYEVVELLLNRGVDIEQRGLNDCTPLQWAAAAGDRLGVEILLAHGADPAARTRIDDRETASELAERGGHEEIARLLKDLE